MKIKIIIPILCLLIFFSCNDLDLSPPSEGSSASWYSNETEVELAVNDLFRSVFWPQDNDDWTDD